VLGVAAGFLEVNFELDQARRPDRLEAEALPERAADFRLVQRLLAGEAAAWSEFVAAYGALVLARVRFTARELNTPLDESRAEDLCAEVFTRLIANDCAAFRRFEGRSTLATWLCVIARRVVMRKLAALRREPSQPMPERIIDSLASPESDDPLRRLLAAEDRRLLAAGLEQLAERQRRLVCLLYFDGCSYREASEQLRIPMNSIGPTLKRVQEKLRQAMGGNDGP
jgi:RNA polymerase sigma-70 factor (ECF subfamily)